MFLPILNWVKGDNLNVFNNNLSQSCGISLESYTNNKNNDAYKRFLRCTWLEWWAVKGDQLSKFDRVPSRNSHLYIFPLFILIGCLNQGVP